MVEALERDARDADEAFEVGAGTRELLLRVQSKCPDKLSIRTGALSTSVLFDDTQVTLVEQGQPGAKHVFQGLYTTGPWEFTLRENYFGSVSGEGFTPGLKETWGGKWLTDIAVGYNFTEKLRLTVGANNVFDEYPDKWDAGITDPNDPQFGVSPQTNVFPALGFVYGWETMPFGMNGGYYYAKLDFKF